MSDLLSLYRTMVRIRRFEERLLSLFRQGALRGTAHVCLGQEAVAAGACAALTPSDRVISNHRGHGHMLARGADIHRLMAELFGKRTGYSLGRGGSQHLAAVEVGFLGSNGITGGGLPVAAGIGLGLKMKSPGQGVCLCFFGDGATAQGTFHEALNLAAVWRLPVIFLCENNQYAMGTPLSQTCPTQEILERAAGFGMARERVDGNDVQAVFEAVRRARSDVLERGCPTFVEARTFRQAGHSRSDTCEYRDKAEEALWLSQDPIQRVRDQIACLKGAGEEALTEIEAAVDNEIDAAVVAAQADPLLAAEEAATLVFPETSSGAACQLPAPPAAEREAGEFSYADALYRAHSRALGDPSVFVMGEDIAEYLGAFRVTRDLYARYGTERVRNTPISENTIVGAGVGAAMVGQRPVVEIMFMDFLLLALDQLANHAGKFSYMFGGQVKVPLTIRTPAGGRRGYGPTHSQCFESLLVSLPGLKVYAPFTVQDAYDLLLAAIFDDAPVVVVEHKLLYGTRGTLDPLQEAVPPGKAQVLRAGSDLTLVGFSHMLALSLQAADALAEHGISVEVVDLRTLVPLDLETVVASVCRTQRAVVVEEGVRRGGIGADLAAQIQEACFGYMDAPVLRVAAADCPVPTAEHLEREVLPQVQDIVAACMQVLA